MPGVLICGMPAPSGQECRIPIRDWLTPSGAVVQSGRQFRGRGYLGQRVAGYHEPTTVSLFPAGFPGMRCVIAICTVFLAVVLLALPNRGLQAEEAELLQDRVTLVVLASRGPVLVDVRITVFG